MTRVKLISGMMAFALVLFIQGVGSAMPPHTIDKGDHAVMAEYYASEAERFTDQEKLWSFMAEFYERHPESKDSTKVAESAAHFRQIAKEYRDAAEEAKGLASEHRKKQPRRYGIGPA